MQPCHFNFLYADLNCFVEPWLHGIQTRVPNSSLPKYVSVLRELPNKLTVYENS